MTIWRARLLYRFTMICRRRAGWRQAGIITPSDFSFARDGIAAEGTPNIEQIIVADVDLNDLQTNRLNGTTIPLYDKRKDVYDNPVDVVKVA